MKRLLFIGISLLAVFVFSSCSSQRVAQGDSQTTEELKKKRAEEEKAPALPATSGELKKTGLPKSKEAPKKVTKPVIKDN